MNDKIDDGGPAFPYWFEKGNTLYQGMTLRDWFAGMALQGLIVNQGDKSWNHQYEFTIQSFLLADAMLIARKK